MKSIVSYHHPNSEPLSSSNSSPTLVDSVFPLANALDPTLNPSSPLSYSKKSSRIKHRHTPSASQSKPPQVHDLIDSLKSQIKKSCLIWYKCTGFHDFDFAFDDPSLRALQAANACEAASIGDIARLRAMMEAGTDIHQPNSDGRTSLHLAVSHNQRSTVHFLVASGASIRMHDHWGNTAFEEACHFQQGSLAHILEMAEMSQQFKALEKEYEMANYLDQNEELDSISLVPAQRKVTKLIQLLGDELHPQSKGSSLHSSNTNINSETSNRQIKTGMGMNATTRGTKNRLIELVGEILKSHNDDDDSTGGNESKKAANETIKKGTNETIKKGSNEVIRKKKNQVITNLKNNDRGACQVVNCSCLFYEQGGQTCARCAHFPASHKLFISEDSSIIVSESNPITYQEIPILVPCDDLNEWPKRLNPMASNTNENTSNSQQNQWFNSVKTNGGSGSTSDPILKSWILPSSSLQFLKPIGDGTSATVYLGTYQGDLVAIKLFDCKKAGNNTKILQKLGQDLIHEFQVMANLKSSSIVSFYGLCIEPQLCLTLEYCPGGSLYDILIQPDTIISWPVCLSLFKQVVIGVAALHDWHPPLVHRDLKPQNILVDKEGKLKVGDFGLSRFVSDDNVQSTLGKLRGTYMYTAPEVYFGDKYTSASDMYSVGIMLWELTNRTITGEYRRPYEEFPQLQYDFQVIIQVARKYLRPSIPESCPPLIKELMTTMWSHEASKRPTAPMILQRIEELSLAYDNDPISWDSVSYDVQKVEAKEMEKIEQDEDGKEGIIEEREEMEGRGMIKSSLFNAPHSLRRNVASAQLVSSTTITVTTARKKKKRNHRGRGGERDKTNHK